MLMSMHPRLSSIKSVDIKPINLDLLLPVIVFACERSGPSFVYSNVVSLKYTSAIVSFS